jgi:hypothetical protein
LARTESQTFTAGLVAGEPGHEFVRGGQAVDRPPGGVRLQFVHREGAGGHRYRAGADRPSAADVVRRVADYDDVLRPHGREAVVHTPEGPGGDVGAADAFVTEGAGGKVEKAGDVVVVEFGAGPDQAVACQEQRAVFGPAVEVFEDVEDRRDDETPAGRQMDRQQVEIALQEGVRLCGGRLLAGYQADDLGGDVAVGLAGGGNLLEIRLDAV